MDVALWCQAFPATSARRSRQRSPDVMLIVGTPDIAQARLRLVANDNCLDQVAPRAPNSSTQAIAGGCFSLEWQTSLVKYTSRIEKADLRAVDEGGARSARAAAAAMMVGHARWENRRRRAFGDPRRLAVDRTQRAAERIEHEALHRRDPCSPAIRRN